MSKSIIITKEIRYEDSEESSIREKIESLRREGYDVLERVGAVVPLQPQPQRGRFERLEIEAAIRTSAGRRTLSRFCREAGVTAARLLSWLDGSVTPTEEEWQWIVGGEIPAPALKPARPRSHSRKPITEDKVERIKSLRREGWRISEIAEDVGVSLATVRRYIGPGDRDAYLGFPKGVPAELIERITDLRSRGATVSQISRLTKVSTTTVRKYCSQS